MIVPDTYEKIYTREQIAERVVQVAKKVNDWSDLVGVHPSEQILAVCVLRGAVFFFADLIREISAPIEPVFCRAQTYTGNNQLATGKGVRLTYDDVQAAGRHVLLVDDICDTGLTLLKLHNVFLQEGAKSVNSVVLIHREVDESKYEPTIGAFSYTGDQWFVGYGLDDEGKNRTLPDIYIINK